MKNIPLLENIEKEKKPIGKGSFGQVFKGKYGSNSIAMKELNQENIIDLVKEAEISFNLYHQNIVRFIGMFKEKDIYYLCMEFVEGKDLRTFLKKKETLNFVDALKISISACEGVTYLARQKIVHRDIAARNFLIKKESNGDFLVKVSDFGMSSSLSDNQVSTISSNKFPDAWIAYEILKAKIEKKERVYSEKTDVWSFGVVLWEIFTKGKQPYKGFYGEEILKRLDNKDYLSSENIPDNVYSLMLKCWNINPNERPSFSIILGGGA